LDIEIVKEMYRLVDAAEAKNIQIRAFGGLAVHVHNKKNHPVFMREYGDLDFIVSTKQRRDLEALMPNLGYYPDKEVNLLFGNHRQIYYTRETKVDIFIGNFTMCHTIPLENRLTLHPTTIPLAELLLTKAQILELNRKDALDITSILLNNETGYDDNEKINLQIINQLFSQDWGLYKTTTINLKRLEEMLNTNELSLNVDESEIVIARINEIKSAFDQVQKPLAWQLRDRVGTRVKWYSEVEEVEQ
jgi:hypothetical protein